MSEFEFARDEVPEVEVPVVPSEVEVGLSAEQKRRLGVAPPLEEYVAREVAITQRMVDNGVFLKDEDGGVGRLARTASYARWRWNGWVACEIESL
jgi:hypothetical protein